LIFTVDFSALEKVLDVPWGRFWVGITWGVVSGALCGEENPRSAFLDHSWALFRTYLAGLGRFTVDFHRWIVDFHRWMRALERVLDVLWGRFWVGITWGLVSGALCGEGNPRSVFLDHSWAVFRVRKNEKQWEVEKKLKSEIVIFFSWSKKWKMIFSGEFENRRKKSVVLYGGTPYNLSLDSTVWRIFRNYDFLLLISALLRRC
jgi:hypothetical protein